MPALSSTYLLPAILLNPPFILHIINTFMSHIMPNPPTVSQSPHPILEHLGPPPGSTLYLDMHADDRLCWEYTVLLVVLQIFAIGRVQDNRTRRRDAKAARLEREKSSRERSPRLANGRRVLGLDGADDMGYGRDFDHADKGPREHPLTGLCCEAEGEVGGEIDLEAKKTDCGSSMTETSEEEMR